VTYLRSVSLSFVTMKYGSSS